VQEKIVRPSFDAYRAIPGWCSDVEAAALQEIAKGKIVLEIGTWKGRSAIAMASTAKHVVCVDTFEGDGFAGPSNPIKQTVDYIHPYKSVISLCSCDWIKFRHLISPSKFGFIYYDADHTYEATRNFLEWMMKYHVDYGIPFGLHDVDENPAHEGVKRALLEYTKHYTLHDRLAIVQ